MDGKVSWSLWMKLPVRIIMCSESSYWASVVRHHIASRRLYHVDMVVQVEDVDDIFFWQMCFKYVKPEKKIKFIAYGINQKGQRETGKKLIVKDYGTTESHCMVSYL